MKLYGAHGGAVAVAIAVLIAPATVLAQATCNTQPGRCTGPITCSGSANGSSQSVYHPAQSPCGTTPPPDIASFDLRATQWLNTCATGNGGCTKSVPPIRYWQYDTYRKANSGCLDHAAALTLANGSVDVPWSTIPGHWFLYYGNWANGAVAPPVPVGQGADGFLQTSNGPNRTVVEISYVDMTKENSINHGSSYMIASVDNLGDFDFDRIKGGSGCTPGSIVPVAVPGLTITGGSGGCVGNTVVTTGIDNVTDKTFFNIPVTITNTAPEYYTEISKNDPATPLISGYQVVYAGGTSATGASEPKFSDPVAGGWQPTHDMTDPTKLAFIPVGTATATVAIPKAVTACTPSNCWYWLATRIIYKDASLNPPNPTTPGTGPYAMSEVSGHCGPVSFGSAPPAVSFKSVTAERTNGGIRINWTTFKEDDTLGFQVVRATGANADENVEVLSTGAEARGAFYPYEVLDYEVAGDIHTSYTYYVQEKTLSNTLGDRSPNVTVPGVALTETSTTGGRNRTTSRQR